MQCILLDDGKAFTTAKGVNIATEFSEFKHILQNKKLTRHKMKRIQSKKDKIGTYQVNKTSLCFDDKRFVQMAVYVHLLIFTKTEKIRFLKEKIQKSHKLS